jgi:hypothetical protein
MAPIRPEVEFGGDFILPQGVKIITAIAAGEGVIGRVGKKSRGTPGTGDQAGDFFLLHQVGRIDEDGNIWPAGDRVDSIAGRIGALIAGGGGDSGEVTPGRKAHDTKLVRLEVKGGGLAAKEADGALGILQASNLMVISMGMLEFLQRRLRHNSCITCFVTNVLHLQMQHL